MAYAADRQGLSFMTAVSQQENGMLQNPSLTGDLGLRLKERSNIFTQQIPFEFI